MTAGLGVNRYKPPGAASSRPAAATLRRRARADVQKTEIAERLKHDSDALVRESKHVASSKRLLKKQKRR